ncbi:MAG: hypothetical protein KF852_06300 [Saprospiraceae bacterium]|nr:hypothetical protein [Saprospiraceae bacterium]
MRSFLPLLLLLFAAATVHSQSPLALGQWRSHLPFQFGRSVTQSNTKIFYAADQALLSLDKSDLSAEFLTKTEGLSNSGIDLVKYHPGSDILAVIYNNSVIDLVKTNEIVTLNQIRNFTNLPGQKKINGAFTLGAAQLYLAASYGVSLINLARDEFEFTTFTGIPVNSVAVLDNRIYAATDEGIYRSPVTGANIADFDNWSLLGPAEGFPGDYQSKALAVWNGRLYADVSNGVFKIENQSIELIHAEPGTALRFISGEGSRLFAGFGNCNAFGCTNAKVFYFESNGNSGQMATGCVSVPFYALEDQQGRVWFADGFNGFRYVPGVADPNCRLLNFNTPRTPNNYQITVRNSEVWVAAGGVDITFSARGSRQGFYSLIDGIWTPYTPDTRAELRGENPNDINDDLTDFLALAFHPSNGKLYAGSFREGLIEFDGETMNLYNKNNSTLGPAIGDITRTRIGGLAFDRDDNLWIANHRAERPISVLKKDGTWQSFAADCGLTEIHQTVIDPAGNKWFVSSNSASGVMVFHEGALDVNGDERCRIITQSNSEMPTNLANCVAVDLDGDVWVGTAQGVVIFECGDPFNTACVGSLRRVERNGFLGLLLESDDVLTIAVDGADRKWVGTRNGVYLLSPTGEEEIAHFTTENSPLPDNTVLAVGIDARSGEVYFGTLRGIVSYRSNATEGSRFQVDPVKVFPNPVRPEYEGPIAIKGLTRDAIVKITDISGQLIYETTALGGQAIWDGRDYTGRRAQTGVYLVFVVSNPRFAGFAGKPETATAKILFVN